jgi:hypothetical protein
VPSGRRSEQAAKAQCEPALAPQFTCRTRIWRRHDDVYEVQAPHVRVKPLSVRAGTGVGPGSDRLDPRALAEHLKSGSGAVQTHLREPLQMRGDGFCVLTKGRTPLQPLANMFVVIPLALALSRVATGL